MFLAVLGASNKTFGEAFWGLSLRRSSSGRGPCIPRNSLSISIMNALVLSVWAGAYRRHSAGGGAFGPLSRSERYSAARAACPSEHQPGPRPFQRLADHSKRYFGQGVFRRGGAGVVSFGRASCDFSQHGKTPRRPSAVANKVPNTGLPNRVSGRVQKETGASSNGDSSSAPAV